MKKIALGFIIFLSLANQAFSIDLNNTDLTNFTSSSFTVDGSTEIFPFFGSAYNIDGTKIFIMETNGGSIYEFDLSVPYDVTTETINSVHSIDFSPIGGGPNRSFEFSNDGNFLFFSRDGLLRKYSLGSPYDLTSTTFVGNAAIAFTTTGETDFSFNTTGEYLAGPGNQGFLRMYFMSTPYDIENMQIISSFQVFTQAGINPTGIEIINGGNQILISQTAGGNAFLLIEMSVQYDLNTASVIQTLSTLNNIFYLNCDFSSINCNGHTGQRFKTDSNAPPLVPPLIPPTSQWTFFTSGYAFYDFGFTLQNFVPDPFGGILSFEIIRPDASTYIADDIDYGFDVNPIVGSAGGSHTFAHNEPGEYQVRAIYNYGGIEVFPFGEEYTPYIISQASVRSDGSDLPGWEVQACDTEVDGFIPGISRFFICATDFISGIWSGVTSTISALKNFISGMGNIFTTEEKNLFGFLDFSLIPKASADFNPADSLLSGESNTESFFDDFKTFATGFLYLVLFTLTIFGILIYKK